MCGIFCLLQECSNTQTGNINDTFTIFKQNVESRGPDCVKINTITSETHNILFSSSVLWLQGNSITEQPLENDKGIFIYNGDIYDGLPDNQSSSDTKLLFELIQSSDTIADSLSQLHGPYAFVYFDKVNRFLHFGRDVFGRRSLLIGKDSDCRLILTSVAKRNTEFNFIEVPSIGTFRLHLQTNTIEIIPWNHRNKNFDEKLKQMEHFLNRQIVVTDSQISIGDNKFIEPIESDLNLLQQIKDETVDAFSTVLSNEIWLNNMQTLKCLLENAIQKRISTQPNYCKNCIALKLGCIHATVGVLFSGGVDCAILALLSNQFVDPNKPIDLINVSFDEANNFLSPDRATGLATLDELKACCPERKWNFVEVNITKNELDEKRKGHVADLIYPLNTILDDSLGCALWFASRGKTESYVSPSRVLLVGMGADELFGGYTKHRAAYKRGSWQGLNDILNEDWQNLPHRNLARDDRVVSDHGRQLRTPYLDEHVVKFVRNLQCWEKTWPTPDIPQGFGEKILLRSLAYSLGLKKAAVFKKRALQFGSRIANSKENAHEISQRLQL